MILNDRATRAGGSDAEIAAILSPADAARAWAALRLWPGYAPTPLRDLPARARAEGVARIAYKDEGGRFGIGSFKALGAAYAVQRHLAETLCVAPQSLFHPAGREAAGRLTVACATDGNYGRAVAWAASVFGCRAVIYIHGTVSDGRARRIAAFGARVVRVPGVYETALARCADEAAAQGWAVISDTAYPGCLATPRAVMAGYTVMVEEALRQWGGKPPTHVFVQAGVGGMAASVAAHLRHCADALCGGARPDVVVVEPERADCCYQSAIAGRPASASGDLDTLCAGLACGEVSLLAWPILSHAARAFMVVPDADVVAQMRSLARPAPGDPAIVAGESAAVGLAGLAVALARPALRIALRLGPASRVLLFGTEGATDPALYERLVAHESDVAA